MTTLNNTPISADAAFLTKAKALVESMTNNQNTWSSYIDYINRSPDLVQALNSWAAGGGDLDVQMGNSLRYSSSTRQLIINSEALTNPAFFARGLAHEIYGHDATRDLANSILDASSSLYLGKTAAEISALVQTGCFTSEALGFIAEYRIGQQAGFSPSNYPAGLENDIVNAINIVKQFLPSDADTRTIDLAAAQYMATKLQATDAGHAGQCAIWAGFVVNSTTSSTTTPKSQMFFSYNASTGGTTVRVVEDTNFDGQADKITTTTIDPDGSSHASTDDGKGNIDLSSYNPMGMQTSHAWQKSDGSYGSNLYKTDGSSSGTYVKADGSYQRYTDDGKGNSIFIDFGRNGQQTGGRWWKADGSRGVEIVNPDGSRQGTAYGADGSYVNYSRDLSGNTTASATYDAQGKLLSSQWSHDDGSFGSRSISTAEGANRGATVIYINDGKGGDSTTIYRLNGSVTRQILNMAGIGISDDGQGLRIETQYGPGGIGVESNTQIHYNPDGSGTSTTTDANGHVTEKSFGPGQLGPLQQPASPAGTPLLPAGPPECPAPPGWLPSAPSGTPLFGPPPPGGPVIPSNAPTLGPNFTPTGTQSINNIKNKFNSAGKIPSPIIVDMDGDGIETTSLIGGTWFDHAGDGFAEKTGWVGKDDGLLVRDLDGNGSIDTGAELFGSETKLINGQKATNGFEALKDLDGNNDGKLNASDSAFSTLRIWRDVNGNGQTDAGEMLSLADAGVQSISVGYENSTATVDSNGNEHRQIGSYLTTAGITRSAEDVWFQVDRTQSVATKCVDVSADIAALPDAVGYGKVYSLHQAMAQDTSGSLKAVVTQFTQAATITERESILQTIIYKWTGVENVDPNSRAATMIYGNAIGDARKLEALEEFMGEEWYGVWCWGTKDPNPHGHAAPVLLEAYAELSELIYGQLAAQSFLKPLYDKINYVWDSASQTLISDLSLVAGDIAAAVNTNRSAGKELLAEFVRSLKGMGSQNSMDIPSFVTALIPLGQDVVSIVDSALAVSGTEYSDNLIGTAGADMLRGLGGNDTLTGNAGDDVLDGGNGDDTLNGNAGVDYLAGGRGNDQLNGGSGIDNYYFGRGDGQDAIHEDYLDDTWISIGDLTIEELTFSRSGANLIVGFQTSVADRVTLADFFKNGEPQSNLVLKKDNGETQILDASALIQMTLVPTEAADVLEGSSIADTINGLGGDDLIFARAGNDTVDGGAGNDNINGGDGVDLLSGGTGNDVLYGEVGNDVLQGGDGNDRLYGGADIDSLTGGIGDDLIDGGSGADTMIGGAGNDSYVVDEVGDVIIELNGEGIDSVSASVNTSLSANVENATLIGASDINVTGNISDNSLIGNSGANSLLGLAGNDELQGWDGNDTLDGGDGTDKLYGGTGDDSLLGGDGDDHLYGQAGDDAVFGGAGSDLLEGGDGNDILTGGAGNDLLDGGTGADAMSGGLGDDAYIVDNVGDVITEGVGEGIENVNSSVSITLSANVENPARRRW